VHDKEVWLSTAYLAPVEYYRYLVNAPQVVIESHEHYVKQSYRNRCVIASANGLQTLSIPVEKPDSPLIRDIRIAEHGDWQHLHWNAIVSAYRSSPFFEYYEDDFRPFYEKTPKFLFDFNEELRELVCRLLDVAPNVAYSTDYQSSGDGLLPNVVSCLRGNDNLQDLRERIHPKQRALTQDLQPYYQVFEHKYGFQPNISIIDLLFNMGTEAIFTLTFGNS
jgi:hypothetical protein